MIVDIHPHIISDNEAAYPPAPLFGKRSDWSKDGGACTGAMLVAAMDDAGVAKSAVVHSSTTYGFDNSFVVDACNEQSDRLLAVGSVDMVSAKACDVIHEWNQRGLAGLRIFTGGSTKEFDPSELEDERAFPAWELMSELGMSMCIQTGPVGLPQVRMLAERFPQVDIILDHLARPDIMEGPPYAKTQGLFDIADVPNIYLKLTPRIFNDVKKGEASAETFFPKVAQAFGAERMAWGSNYPNSPGTLAQILANAQAGLACLTEQQRAWIFGKTALKIYPSLAD